MIFAVALFAFAVLWRVIAGFVAPLDQTWLHNFAPFSAIALLGAVYLPRRAAVVAPIAALLVSDVILNVFVYKHVFVDHAAVGWEMLSRYAAVGLTVALGLALRKSPRFALLLAGSVVSSVMFYVVTNTGSWMTDPAYAKTFGGWIQALTSGVPGLPSTLSFYRNTLISDILFTTLFVLCMRVSDPRPPQAATATA